MGENNKCIVIGLDGATFELMNPLIGKGKLTTIKKMMEEGVHGVLKSTIPPLTGPAWVSFATGKNPGKHGCYDFELPENSLDQFKMISSKDINGDTFYEVLDREGKKCTLINLPCSYPPRIRGVVITDFLTRGSDFIFPQRLVQEIPEFRKYRIIPKQYSSIKKYISDVRDLEKVRFECARKLFQKDWDFFFILFQGTDWLQHRIYDRLVSGEASEAFEFYEELDGYIRWFVENAKKANILIMSDHGFRSYKKVFAINKWLMNEGYLKVKPREARGSTFRERSTVKIPFTLVKHRWLFNIASFFYRIFKRMLPSVTPVIRTAPDTASVAYSIHSSANGNCCGIYINSKKRFRNGSIETVDYEKVRSEIMDKLEKLHDKAGTRIFNSVLRREDLYFGECLNKAPDIFLFSDEYDICPFVEVEAANEHSLNGIFITYGKDIKKDVKISNAEIIDLAPTILHLMKVPIQKDMDGKVLEEIFREDSELSKRPIIYQEVDEKERIKERIRRLKTRGGI